MNVKLVASVEHLRKHYKTGKKIRLTACVSVIVIYTSVVLLKAIVSSEMAFKLRKVMGSGKSQIPRCTEGSVHTTKLQSNRIAMQKFVHEGKKWKVFFQNNTVPPRSPELSFLKEVQPSVTSDNRDTVVGDTCVSSSVG